MNRTLPTVNRFSRLPSPLALALFGLVLAACGCASAALQDGSYSTKTSSVDVHTAQVRVSGKATSGLGLQNRTLTVFNAR